MNNYEKQMARFGGPHYPDPVTLEKLQQQNEVLRAENDILRKAFAESRMTKAGVEYHAMMEERERLNGGSHG